jgi:hypothetical protein
MRRCVWITLLALTLAWAIVATAAAVNSYQVTGPVLEVSADKIVVQKGKDKWELGRDANTKVSGNLAKGKRVTIKYRMVATDVTVK